MDIVLQSFTLCQYQKKLHNKIQRGRDGVDTFAMKIVMQKVSFTSGLECHS